MLVSFSCADTFLAASLVSFFTDFYWRDDPVGRLG